MLIQLIQVLFQMGLDGLFQFLYGFGIILMNNAGNAFGPEFAVIFISVYIVEKKDASFLFPAYIGRDNVRAIEPQ